PREIINEGEDGYLIPPYHIEEMAAKIETLIIDEKQRILFSKNTEKGIEKFCKRRIYSEWEELIETLCGGEE
ncbi:hypothetical protein CLONEX_00166, partial [[Clostridium] nexile DSM 1787]